MSIGGENRFGRVVSGALKHYAEAAQAARAELSYEVCRAGMASLAQEIPAHLAEKEAVVHLGGRDAGALGKPWPHPRA